VTYRKGQTPWNKGVKGLYHASEETKAKLRQALIRHGHNPAGGRTPTYRSWHMMKQRSLNPNDPRWRDYGGRGITVCGHLRTFTNFLAVMGVRPDGKTLDRIDNDGSYTCGTCEQCWEEHWPLNVRWASASEQQRDRQRDQAGNYLARQIGGAS
jgi:hypothetical protein